MRDFKLTPFQRLVARALSIIVMRQIIPYALGKKETKMHKGIALKLWDAGEKGVCANE